MAHLKVLTSDTVEVIPSDSNTGRIRDKALSPTLPLATSQRLMLTLLTVLAATVAAFLVDSCARNTVI